MSNSNQETFSPLFRLYPKLLLIIFFVMGLTACAPKFKIESKYNEFRKTHSCDMENNVIKKHNAKGSLSFNLLKNTMVIQKNPSASPYVLSIENRQGFTRFKNDSHLRLLLTNNDGAIETILLKARMSNSFHNVSTNYIPGYSARGVYSPGYISTNIVDSAYVFYHLSLEILNKIIQASSISLELETISSTIKATLSEENIKNIQEFRKKCVY